MRLLQFIEPSTLPGRRLVFPPSTAALDYFFRIHRHLKQLLHLDLGNPESLKPFTDSMLNKFRNVLPLLNLKSFRTNVPLGEMREEELISLLHPSTQVKLSHFELY